MGKILYLNKEIAENIVMSEAQRRLRLAAEILKDRVKSNLQSAIKGSYNRPIYKTGKYAGKWWTARDAGELLKSIRVVQKQGDILIGHRNIWVVCGNSKAYWAAIYEYATDPKKGKKFFRPAIASTRGAMKEVLENG